MSSIQNINIIPEPVLLNISSGLFILTEGTRIYSDRELLKVSEYLKNLLLSATGYDLIVKETKEKINYSTSINLKLVVSKEELGFEGYSIEVSSKDINISAPYPAGIFYGIQTLRQLLPPEIENVDSIKDIEWQIPCLKLKDFPRFSWRGYMLDEARHFHGKAVVKKMIDLMALLKLNKFHWHLTDDQGWRIEIKKYPKLTEIGSKREESPVSRILMNKKKKNGIPHLGFYSQEDIQEIIDYASERFIKIIPEIDMPGHTRAALASYPNLSCKGYPFKVSTHWGIHKDVLCVGKEEVFEFVQDVLDEIITLFPFNIIHIGGDEVLKERWSECPFCQSRLKNEGLKDEKDLRAYFTNRIYRYLSSLEQEVICWNDGLNKQILGKILCQFWHREKKKVINHIKMGGDVIKSNFAYTYLDLSYSFLPLKRTYKYDPIPKMLRKKYHNKILGLEAPMWGELIPTTKRLEWQTFPRLIAFAETGWTPKNIKNYSKFKPHLTAFLKRLDILEVNYAKKNEYKPKLIKRVFGFLHIREGLKGNN